MTHASRAGSSSIRLLQLTAFVSTLDRFAMPPMLVAIALDLGAPLSQIVHAAGAYFLAYGLMQPVWGLVSDRLGVVRTLRITLVLSGIATAVSALANTALGLGVLRCLAGALFGAAFPSTLIYLGDTVPATRRQGEIARLMIGVALGTAAASAGAGALAHLIGWRVVFLLTGLAGLAVALALFRLPATGVSRNHGSLLTPIRLALRSRVTVLVLLLAFAEGAVLLGALTLLPPAVEATDVSSAVAGGVTAAYGLAVYASVQVIRRLAHLRHPSEWIALGGASVLVGCLTMGISQQPHIALLVALLLGFAWAAMHSSLQTWATEVLPAARATVVSLFAGALFLGSAVGAALVAGLAEADRYREIFLWAAAVAVPLSLAAAWGRATWRRPNEEPT